jgi:hypothetical protein
MNGSSQCSGKTEPNHLSSIVNQAWMAGIEI